MMHSKQLPDVIGLAQQGNHCATELVYLRYKPFVEITVAKRKLIERADDVSLDKEDVIQDILLESMSTAIMNFDFKKFLNSKKKDIDYYFQTSVNYAVNKWLKIQSSWKSTPHYRDCANDNVEYRKTINHSLVLHETKSSRGGSHPMLWNENGVNEALSYYDRTYEYRALKELIVEKVIYVLDKFFSRRIKYKVLDKHKIVCLLEMRYSGCIYKEIAEEVGILLKDLFDFFICVIKPAVLLAFDEVYYYKKYISNSSATITTIRNEKGEEFVNSILDTVVNEKIVDSYSYIVV